MVFVTSFSKFYETFESLSAGVRILHYALCQENQIAPFNDTGAGHFGNTEGAALRHLHVDDHSAMFPVQELDAVTAAIDEDVYIAVQRIAAKFVRY